MDELDSKLGQSFDGMKRAAQACYNAFKNCKFDPETIFGGNEHDDQDEGHGMGEGEPMTMGEGEEEFFGKEGAEHGKPMGVAKKK
jgi:hypothetical protein